MGPSAPDTSTRLDPKSPVRSKNPSPPRQDAKLDSTSKPDAASNAAPAKPLAPPPRPGQQGTNTPDYFAPQPGGSLSLEPNPFEQSFGGGGPETPGGTKLPSVAALTSPSSLLPGTGSTPFNWGGGSLRTGPLSPAMLSGPATDYFTEGHLRGGFPTPNESSLRSGLTPGGSGSMFPAPSPNSQALFAQLASGGATPNTIDFHRTAMSAAAKREQQQQQQHNQPQNQQQPVQPQTQAPAQQPATTQPQDMPNGTVVKVEAKPSSGPFDGHDNDAANGLYMLAQGRNGPQGSNPPANHAHPAPANAPKANGNAAKHTRGASEATNGSEENDDAKPGRAKGKKTQANNRRKADEAPAKAPPAKKSKGAAPPPSEPSDMSEDDEDGDPATRSKMTDEEKRKNFLERNRVAALKCRQRKKQWLANLQAKVEMFSTENDALTSQITALREEVVNLKTLLLAHKDCPVTQQQGMQGAYMQPVMEPFANPQMAYMATGPMPNQQQVMAGQGVPRRFS